MDLLVRDMKAHRNGRRHGIEAVKSDVMRTVSCHATVAANPMLSSVPRRKLMYETALPTEKAAGRMRNAKAITTTIFLDDLMRFTDKR